MIPKAIFIAINLICITVSSYFVVDGVYGNLATRLTRTPPSQAEPVFRGGKNDTAAVPLSAYQAVLDRNLFETRIQSVSQPSAESTQPLEETQLNLKLWGTVSGDVDGDYAVIEDVKAREQNLYRVGDAIQTATVKAIHREKVILSVNGKDEMLQMQELETDRAAASPGRLPGRTGLSSPSSGAVRTQRISLRRAYIDQAMTDMASLMTQVQIQPHMENGMPAGLALSSIKPNSIFRRMGLRNGDVITGVDGREISAVDDALRLVDNLKSASQVSLQLKRRGREKNIEYRIR
ncbi:type II secretion system protein GspC [Desulfosarcina ovata]|uniref:General secretion pathway protein GspC n=1 Tax=Desulfosarcina ovata subsp. ovata TaxID=2752305 RepID=A0A5K8A4F4_9BACT|nr:type II secretion system protein GspC [Desulfosarcina ovata]BBO87463.1 general secretion pathway protein GspC [Desulfosarcina ovata subsp. ovata]